MILNLLLFKATLLVYFASTILYLISVISLKDKLAQYAKYALVGGFLLHCLTISNRWLATGVTPVASFHESLSFFAFSLVGIFLLFELRYRTVILGAFVCPLALILMIGGTVAPRQPVAINPVLDSWWFPIHVTLAFLGHAIFAVAGIAGIMYLLQERMLKSKKFSALFYRLPSLDVLDSINYKCLTFGFPLMTMGIISGAIWANSAWGGYWRWDPKETWALITWFLYAALLHGRLTVGWRGRRAAIFAIIGFLCLLFTFFGVNLFLSGVHSFSDFAG
ncbi:MAG TPA: c-type cytochrome biogenesis protein CcsB [Desulfuromonadales bacterium]|nr:c-type cytochrome biogenesis protein CcsB [Desulfuromonadales bacterium]